MPSDPIKNLITSSIRNLTRQLFTHLFKKWANPIKPKPPIKDMPIDSKKIHPWRLCPIGQHRVIDHLRSLPSHPDQTTHVNKYCRKNPTNKNDITIKDYLSNAEIQIIAETHFSTLSGPPASGTLPHQDSDKYDSLIHGWTIYWNEVFQPQEPLDPNLVKALIASESGFRLDPPDQIAKKAGKAKGLIQLTEQAIKVLDDPNGELKDHLIEFSTNDAYNANMSICAGIRWLFHKKYLTSKKLKRETTWIEAIADYKGFYKDIQSGEYLKKKGIKNILANYKKLKI